MKKLTLVNLMCRGKCITQFLMLPIVDGKAILSLETIDELFRKYWGFTPQRGETISMGW